MYYVYNFKYSLECLTVVDDSNHVLHITLRKLSFPQVLLFVDNRLLSVPIRNNAPVRYVF